MTSQYSIFCPECDALILEAIQCPACDWMRPSDKAQVGELASAPVELPVRPIAGSYMAAGRNRVWVTGHHDDSAALVNFHLPTGELQIHSLPQGSVAQDLCASSGTILFGTNDSAIIPSLGKEFYAWDINSGEPKWQYDLPDAYALSPAVTTSSAVHFVSDAGRLYSLDLQRGQPIHPPINVRADARFAPYVSGDWAVLSGSLSDQSSPGLTGVRLSTALEMWSYRASGPILWPIAGDGKVVCAGTANGVICVDIHSGKSRWSKPFQPPRLTSKGALTCPPVFSSGFLLLSCGAWIEGQASYKLYGLDVLSGHLVWEAPLPTRLSVPPQMVGSVVIYSDAKGSTTALDLESRRRLWSVQIPGKPATWLLLLDDYIAGVTQDGLLFWIRYRPLSQLPAHPPTYYENAGDWRMAGVAYALTGDLSNAGECLLRAGDARHALKLYTQAGDRAGIARCYEALQEWDGAIEIYLADGDLLKEAQVLSSAGRFEQAAVCYESAGDPVSAGLEYEKAGLTVKAAACYLEAQREDMLNKLAHDHASESLASWLAETSHWSLAVQIFIQIDDLRSAAKLAEAKGDLQGAFQLWRQAGNWDKCRALAQELGDRQAEAEVCIAQKQYGEAARLYEEMNRWEDALKYYEQANMFEHSLRALANLGSYEEAAKRLVARSQHGQAARHYQKAAEQVLVDDQTKREVSASFWRLAAEHYALEGEKGQAQTSVQQVARLLSQPLLSLAAVNVDHALKIDYESQFEFVIANNGFGPARKLRLLVQSKGFGYEKPGEVGSRLDVLAKGQTETIRAGLKPLVPGTGVELRLDLAFTPLGGKEEVVGPFQAFMMVQGREEARPMTVHIGSFEYIGPGGVHAQDAVVVRPTYNLSDEESSPSLIDKIQDTIDRGLKHAQDELGVESRYCDQCGTSIPGGATRCVNPQCNAGL